MVQRYKTFRHMQEKEQYISPIKQRILLFAGTLGISKRDFYAKIGVSRGTLESKTGITEDVITKFLATYPAVSVNWLMTGEGDMLKSGQAGTTVTVNTSRHHVSGDNNVVGSDNSSVTVQASNTEELLRKQIELLMQQTEQQARMIETLTRLLNAK